MKQSDMGTPGISAMHAGPIAVAPIIMRSDAEDWPDANGAAVCCGTSDMATAAEAMKCGRSNGSVSGVDHECGFRG
jgi:hypothetical protein